MSDHYHYDYASTSHDHHGQYADERHDHDLEYAEKRHRHYGLEKEDERLQAVVRELREALNEYEHDLAGARGRIRGLEDANVRLVAALRAFAIDHDTVRATGMADETHLAISGELVEALETFADAIAGTLDDGPEPEEYDPGPEVDDEGGMSEYRYPWPEDYQRGM